MAEINTSPTCYDNLVVGGQNFTEVAGDPVSATVEIKGTDGAYLLPTMSQQQMNNLDNEDSTVTNGLQVYNSDVRGVMTYVDGFGWILPASNGILEVNIQLQENDVNEMFTTPFELIPDPGENFIVSILSCNLVADLDDDWTDGGDIFIQYGTAGPILAVKNPINTDLLATTADGNLNEKQLGVYDVIYDTDALAGKGIYITNDDETFNGGAGSILFVNITYRLVDLRMPI